MAEGAGTAALIGGVVMILTAGIPVLFLSGKDKPDSSATKAAGLEQGLRAEMGEAAFEESILASTATLKVFSSLISPTG